MISGNIESLAILVLGSCPTSQSAWYKEGLFDAQLGKLYVGCFKPFILNGF